MTDSPLRLFRPQDIRQWVADNPMRSVYVMIRISWDVSFPMRIGRDKVLMLCAELEKQNQQCQCRACPEGLRIGL
jgi:hypothetical protein